MRHTHKLSLLLASILLASAALAQTNNPSDADASPERDSIAAARTRYAQIASVQQDDSNDGTLAQFSQPEQRRCFPRHPGYPRYQSYQTPWRNHGNGRNVLIGSAIGFGIGAALGASNSAHNGTPVSGGVLIGGGLFGFLGGAIGSTFGRSHPFGHRRRGLPMPGTEEDEEANRESHPGVSGAKNSSPARSASGTPPSLGQSLNAAVVTSRSAAMPLVGFSLQN